jgi:hypothetical protein
MTDAAWKAIDRLRNIQDEVEYAAFPAGDVVCLSRKAANSILSDLKVVARLIRKMAEGGHG